MIAITARSRDHSMDIFWEVGVTERSQSDLCGFEYNIPDLNRVLAISHEVDED